MKNLDDSTEWRTLKLCMSLQDVAFVRTGEDEQQKLDVLHRAHRENSCRQESDGTKLPKEWATRRGKVLQARHRRREVVQGNGQLSWPCSYEHSCRSAGGNPLLVCLCELASKVMYDRRHGE